MGCKDENVLCKCKTLLTKKIRRCTLPLPWTGKDNLYVLRLDKEKVMCMYSGESANLRKERNPDTSYDIGET